MNINQIAQELYGKYFADLTPSQQDEVWAVYDRRTTATSSPNSAKEVLVAGLRFKALSLDGEPIEMSFSEISTKYIEYDVFYYNNGIDEPVACQLSSLVVVLP